MENSDMHFVAIVGGVWNLDEATRADAIDAAKDIGAELAKAGFGLVVYFSMNSSQKKVEQKTLSSIKIKATSMV